MTIDRCTKGLLGTIAVLLTVQAFNRSAPAASPAPAAPPAATSPFDGVDVLPYSSPYGFVMFDRKTGGIWAYQLQSVAGFSFARLGAAGYIRKPGDEVRPTP